MADFERFVEVLSKKEDKRVVNVTVRPFVTDCEGAVWFTDLMIQEGDMLSGYTPHTEIGLKESENAPVWEYAGVYADSGITGTLVTGRSEFGRLLEDCEAGRIDIILCKSISRFARNTVDLLNTVRHLKDIGVEVRFEKEQINSMSGDGELMLSILASFAQEESRSISENVKWGIHKRFKNGEIGAANKHILGYQYDDEQKKYIIMMLKRMLAMTTRGHKLLVPDDVPTDKAIHALQLFLLKHRDEIRDPDDTRTLTFHGLRHNYGSSKYKELTDRGMSALDASFEVSHLLGHNRSDVTNIYTVSVRKEGSADGK